MSTSKRIDKICIAVIAVTLVVVLLFMNGASLGIPYAERVLGYEKRLFDTDRVHSIEIVMDDWESFIENCESEEYASCTAVIDGEQYKNIGIRAKGNTSLSNVKSLGSQRYSFKLEFDQYESGKSYYGLDKLCLNNLIQDNTMMKDYLVYQMMGDFGVDAPLCSFVYITVNGEDWGLYLAVEGVEDGFLTRNYGSDSGALYKPDSMSFGGGRGNGKDFKMEMFDQEQPDSASMPQDGERPELPDGENIPQAGERLELPDGEGMPQDGEMPEPPQDGNIPQDGERPELPQGGNMPQDGGAGGSKGSDDVKLKYIDDDPDSYANIFDNAKTDVTESDKKRLIASLESLSAYRDLEEVVDTEEVLRYFVVHNFVCNGDSYTGNMIHNYYLYEKDGQLGMIPWDYNLAFGTFQGNNAASAVNASIDNPVSDGDVDDRPMVGWIFSDATYTSKYHALFEEFVERWFTNGELRAMIEETAELIRPYVETDPTKFCTTDEFDTGVEALSQFVTLRAEAVSSQLAGDTTAVDTGSLDLSDMGTMNNGMNGGGPDAGENRVPGKAAEDEVTAP